MSRILKFSLMSMRNSGGADVRNKGRACRLLSMITKQWEWLAERENRRWAMFGLAVTPGYKFCGLESSRRRYEESAGETLEEQCRHCTFGGLALSLGDCSGLGEGVKEEWTKTLRWLIQGHKSIKQLQLLLMDSKAPTGLIAGPTVASFPHLEKLFLLAPKISVFGFIYLEPAFSPSCLRRIDLKFVNIVVWPITLPTVMTLTLDTISIDDDDKYHVCKVFFSSFPNLEALGLNGIERLAPESLAQFKVINSVTRLYIGPRCLFRDNYNTPIPLVDHLSRYFRCKVKHLVLPPNDSNLPILASILDTHSDKPHPLYLSRLSTIKIAVDRTKQGGLLESEKGIVEMPKNHGLYDVSLKRWMAGEGENMVDWEP